MLLLLTCCLLLLPLWESVIVLCFVVRKLVALLSLSSWCLVVVVRLFLMVPWVCLQFMIVVFPDHTHYVCTCFVVKLIQLFTLFALSPISEKKRSAFC